MNPDTTPAPGFIPSGGSGDCLQFQIFDFVPGKTQAVHIVRDIGKNDAAFHGQFGIAPSGKEFERLHRALHGENVEVSDHGAIFAVLLD